MIDLDQMRNSHKLLSYDGAFRLYVLQHLLGSENWSQRAHLMRSASLVPKPIWKLYTEMSFSTESGRAR